jgi:hypothetical protein
VLDEAEFDWDREQEEDSVWYQHLLKSAFQEEP